MFLSHWTYYVFIREKKYEIEEADLEGKYKDWQKKVHPDLVHSKSKVDSCMLCGWFLLFLSFPLSPFIM